MKRFIALVLVTVLLSVTFQSPALATEITYDPVNITLLSNSADEQAFREWAADVIDMYYTSYCMHDFNLSEYYAAVDFPHLHEFRNSIWGVQYCDLDLSAMGQFDGIYRTYYYASIAKLDYDYNISKSTYTIVRKDNETDDEYIERMMPFYKILLIDAMEDEGVIDLASLDSVNPSKAGAYTLKTDENGNMTMQLDESGVMGSLDLMAKAEANKAWANFGEAMIDTCLTASRTLAEMNSPATDGVNLMKSVSEAAADAAVELLRTLTDGFWDREVNKLKNNLTEAVRCSIANKELRDFNRTMQYLKNVYNGKVASFAQYRSDAVFLMAVNELIAEMDKQYDDCHEALANLVMKEFPIEYIMTTDDMCDIVLEEFVTQIFNIVFSPIDNVCKNAFKNGTGAEKMYGFISNYCSTLLKGIIKLEMNQAIENVKGGKSNSLDREKLKKDMMQELLDISIKILSELEDGESGDTSLSDKGDKCYREIIAAVAKEFKTIYEVLEKANNSTLVNDDWQKLKDSSFTIIGAVFKAVNKNLGENIVQAAKTKFSGKLSGTALNKFKEMLDATEKTLDSSIKTGEAVAKAVKATVDSMSDEKQTSYRAVAMASAFKASSALELDLSVNLGLLKSHSGGIKGAILDPEATLATDIYTWTSEIMLQVKYDIIGSRWLVEILSLGEMPNALFQGDPAFFKYLLRISKDNVWANQMTAESVNSQRTRMITFRNYYNRGWKEAFNKFK